MGVLERYRYTIAAVAIAMTLLPRLPGIGEQVNGAYLAIHVGSVSFQPAELAKVAIVIFLASYLHDNRQILVTAGRRVLGVTIPPMKQFGPMLIVWGAAMATLLITRELGTSLMFYGAFLALLYVATGRFSFPLIGLLLFAAGAWFLAGHVSHVHARVLAWEHPFDPTLYHRSVGGSYQLAQSLFAQADGGLLGTGFDQSLLRAAHGGPSILPVPESDMIYAVIVNELGLAGGAALLLVYLLLVARGLKTAVARARLVLEAAGDRTVVRARPAGVRDRRGRHARDPADRRDAAVRRLRRLLGRHELRARRAAARDLGPRAPALRTETASLRRFRRGRLGARASPGGRALALAGAPRDPSKNVRGDARLDEHEERPPRLAAGAARSRGGPAAADPRCPDGRRWAVLACGAARSTLAGTAAPSARGGPLRAALPADRLARGRGRAPLRGAAAPRRRSRRRPRGARPLPARGRALRADRARDRPDGAAQGRRAASPAARARELTIAVNVSALSVTDGRTARRTRA